MKSPLKLFVIALVWIAVCLLTAYSCSAQKMQSKKSYASKDTIPGIVFAQVHMASMLVNGKFALDSIKDKWMDTYFIARFSGCVAQQMAFGVVYNEKECSLKAEKHKMYLHVYCPNPEQEYQRQINQVYKVVQKNWQLMLNKAGQLQLNEDGASWVLDKL
jgi:hypothetical protein